MKQQLLDIEEGAELLGLTLPAVRGYVRRKSQDFPQPGRFGRRLLWSRARVEAYLRKMDKKANA